MWAWGLIHTTITLHNRGGGLGLRGQIVTSHFSPQAVEYGEAEEGLGPMGEGS